MTDKNRVRKRFQTSADSYNENALIQKETAGELIEKLLKISGKNYDRILEIGCGTGLLTQKIKENLTFKVFYANDLSSDYEKRIQAVIPNAHFYWGDAEEIQFPENLNLIISNAVFQWFDRLEHAFARFHQILQKNGSLAFTTFGNKNYQEIKSITGNSLQYPSLSRIIDLGKKYFLPQEAKKTLKTLYFKTPLEVIKHIHKTGVNGNSKAGWNRIDFSDFEKKYQDFYAEGRGYSLTYEPYYFIFKKEEE